jgi:hypothetical protein
MRPSFLFVLAMAVTCSALAAGPAWADPSPAPEAVWNYTASATPGSDQVGGSSGPTIVLQGVHYSTIGSQDIVGTNVFTYTNSNTPITISPTDVKETIYLRDRASGETGSVTFDFTMSGTVSSTAANLVLVPNGPTTAAPLHLGHYFYTVSVDSFAPPAEPGPFAGRLFFDVQVQHNPEPSSVVLASLGLGLVGMARWRKRR